VLKAEPTHDAQVALAWLQGAYSEFLYAPLDEIPEKWANVVTRCIELDSVLGGDFGAASEKAFALHHDQWYARKQPDRPDTDGDFSSRVLDLFLAAHQLRLGMRSVEDFAGGVKSFQAALDDVLYLCPKYHGEIQEWFLD